MKIKFAKITLADSGAGMPVQDLRVRGLRAGEVVEYPEAEEVGLFDRKNRSKGITFGSEREHASEADAQAFVAQHDEELPVQDVLEMICGAGRMERKLFLPALLTEIESSAKGCRSYHRYSFVTGVTRSQRSEV